MTLARTVDRYLTQVRADYDVVDHVPTTTAEGSARAAHVATGRVAKAVVLRDRKNGRPFMAVIPASHRLNLRWIREEFDLDLRLATEGELVPLFPDCEVGAVPPLGPAYHLTTLWDERLDAEPDVYLEAGDHAHLIHLRHGDFERMFEGLPHAVISNH